MDGAISAAPEIDQPARDDWLSGSVESHPVRSRPRRAHRIGLLICPEEKRIFGNRFRCVATSRRIAAKGRPVLTLAHLIGENAIVETVEDEIMVDTPSVENVSEELPEVPLDNSYNLGITEELVANKKETQLEELEKDEEQIDVPEVKQTEVENTEKTEDMQSLGEQLEIMDKPFDAMSNEMEEVSFPLENLEKAESIQLREPNDIYYEMNYEARKKAKMAKEMALSCYLEAKNIKNTYMLNDLPESDSDENISEP